MRQFFVALALPLMGCVAGVGDTHAVQPAKDLCAASRLQDLIGKPESVLTAMTLPASTRIIHPKQPVIMDLNPARLNILIDAAGIVNEVHCG